MLTGSPDTRTERGDVRVLVDLVPRLAYVQEVPTYCGKFYVTTVFDPRDGGSLTARHPGAGLR